MSIETEKRRRDLSAKMCWRERIRSLGNILPIASLLWDAGHYLVVASLIARLIRAAVPVCRLWIAKAIIDRIIQQRAHLSSSIRPLITLVIMECGLVIL